MKRSLSDAQVLEAYQMILDGINHQEIASRFGACRSTITQIATGKKYKHLGLEPVFSRNPIGSSWHCSLAEKLSSGSTLNIETGCIEWKRNTSNGYGMLKFNGRSMRAHRAAYELVHGEVKEGNFILHSCDNKKCINVAHLREGSHLDNMNDRNIRDRLAYGERSGMSRLNESEVIYIMDRMRNGESGSSVARALGVVHSTVFSVWNGETWNRVTGLPKKVKK